MRACIEPGCANLTQRTRCPNHARQKEQRRTGRDKYDYQWQQLSRQLRAQTPWCGVCGSGLDLTVDHPTRAVLCRSHHSALEAERRSQARLMLAQFERG